MMKKMNLFNKSKIIKFKKFKKMMIINNKIINIKY